LVALPPVARLMGICGGSGAGKTTLANALLRRLDAGRVSSLAFDAYYRDLSHLTMAERREVNYDHPDSLDHELFVAHLRELRAGRSIEVPEYDFATHTRTGRTNNVTPREIVIVDGILLFCFPEIRDVLDHAVFIDVPEDVRLERRIRRDIAERGRDADDVRRQFAQFVAPMHNEFVQPYQGHGDRLVGASEALPEVADELIGRLGVGGT
jgi:uridine kinase